MGVAAAKADGAATVARLKATPADDDCFGHSTIRADGRVIHPAYLWEVKKPSESKGPWDYYKLLATTPGDQGVPSARQGRLFTGQGVTVARHGLDIDRERLRLTRGVSRGQTNI